ncbi:GTP-binding protein [Breznakia sp. PF5-3]|uniref:GTPase ObgE n=1 Tax=unclassified Breznakia TaxID=2623764 RepID=UPI002407538B|nr:MULTISPECIES: GTPase ObgE [unclassified Breznakia]MDF9824424.1 GTP-binding protein [Breznakia sp. PM6-1]MDF9835153.1 GTP-binding protein [Breznakia sp. PF5-3]MDF9838322.1 GTP-binding protein [Breznakia sp. PFB2-8]MDF9860338.1 GTP-binding protein [Breznakia sp. PH5-24]
MQFIDRVKLKLKAGNGGNGMSSFRREKYVPFGGPSGGDGGRGGNVIFAVDEGKSTLLDLRYNRKIVAADGGKGKTKKMHGATGQDFVVRVPLGTIVRDLESGHILADLTRKDQQAVICTGGKGGRGNFRFKTSKNTAPTYSEKGGLGEQIEVEVELKVLADVGLVGFPSVGKSTLLSVVSKARPEIADYHFTTIQPNLGMVQVADGRSFVMADLPGLIEGAAEGKGLGHQFLRHIERCRVIIHVIDMGAQDGRDPLSDYTIINNELETYQYRLLERPQIVIANKMDLDDAQENLKRFKEAYPDVEVFETMTMIGEGLDPVLYRAADLLDVTPAFPLYDEVEETEGVLYKFEPEKPAFEVHNLGNGRWMLDGDEIENAYRMATLDTTEGEQRFARKMRVLGVEQALRDAGCQDGDTVSICDFEFEFVD